MSYIRTKDGVYENANPYFIEDNKLYMGWDYPADFEPDFLGDILNQSENLEELCDEFVCEWFEKKVNRYRHVYCRFKIGQSKELYRRDKPLPADVNFEIYAGIWVNGKGLIYVAKMNENGELELI